MASIRRRKDCHQVRIRRKGQAVTRSFKSFEDASRWARKVERSIDLGEPVAPQHSPSLLEIADRYRTQVATHQRREENAVTLLTVALRQGFATESVLSLGPSPLAAYRDYRLRTCQPETVRREMGLIRTILRYAEREWGIRVNPAFFGVRLPPCGRPRDRRLTPAQRDMLLGAAKGVFRDVIMFAMETGMRRSEIVRLHRADISLQKRLALVQVSKNGQPRLVPLSPSGVKILAKRLAVRSDRLFPLTGRAIQMRWMRLARKLAIANLRFHDLRHEAISRFFERGLSVPEVALISGHRDPRMLFRYTHLRAEDIAKKLASPTSTP